MKIDVCLSINDLKQDSLQQKTVVVIDSLRATSTILTLLHLGCQKVIPVETVGQAFQFSSLTNRQHILLVGERFCKKINGFDYDNSPTTLLNQEIRNKIAIISTSNGTKALQKAKKKSAYVLVGSFLNAAHCMQESIRLGRDLILICAGRQGEFALEDGLTAGLMINQLRQFQENLQLSDLALMLEQSFDYREEHLLEIIRQGETGQRLIHLGLEKDIEYCLQVNQFNFTGIYQDEEITLL